MKTAIFPGTFDPITKGHEDLIARAREEARARQTTLNQLFRQWLAEVAEQKERSSKIGALLDRLDGVDTGGNFSREEMNAR